MALCKNLVVGLAVGLLAVACGGGGNGNGPGSVDDLNEDDLKMLCEQVREVYCLPLFECSYREENCEQEINSNPDCQYFRESIDNFTGGEDCVPAGLNCGRFYEGRPTDQLIQWARTCFEDSTADPLECTYIRDQNDLYVSKECYLFFAYEG